MRKKILVIIVSVILIFSSISPIALAATNTNKIILPSNPISAAAVTEALTGEPSSTVPLVSDLLEPENPYGSPVAEPETHETEPEIILETESEFEVETTPTESDPVIPNEIEVDEINEIDEPDEETPTEGEENFVEIEEVDLKELKKIIEPISDDMVSKSIAPGSIVAMGKNQTQSLPGEIGGNKIENLTVEWRTEDYDGIPERLHLEWNDNNAKNIQAQINTALSGERDYAIGAIQLTIPKNIFEDRLGKPYGRMALSVPEEPDKTGLFAYADIGDSYLITNTRAISAASGISIQVSFRDLIPSEIKDFESGYVSDKFFADLKVVTADGLLMGKTSNEIDCTVDTAGLIRNGYNFHNNFVGSLWPADWPTELKPSNHEEYVYVRWSVNATTQANQYFDVVLDFDARASADAQEAIVLGYKSTAGGEVYDGNGTGSISIPVATNEYKRDGQNFYGSVYVAYPLTTFDTERNYDLGTTAKWTMTTVDDLTTTTTEKYSEITFSPIEVFIPEGNIYIRKDGHGRTRQFSNGRIYGIYSILFNKILGNKPADTQYKAIGGVFGGPWTLRAGGNPENINDYNHQEYTLSFEDYEMRFNNNEPLTSEDFEVKSLQIDKPRIWEFFELDGGDTSFEYNGEIFSLTEDNPLFGYKRMADTEIPELIVYVRVSEGEWQEVAKVDYSSGSAVITPLMDQITFDGSTVHFMENVTDWKIEATTKVSQIEIVATPTVTIKPSERNIKFISGLYKSSTAPQVTAINMARTDLISKGTLFEGPSFHGMNILSGFSYGADLNKTMVGYENNSSQRSVKLKYRVDAKVQTNLNSIEEVEEAIDDGLYEEQKDGVFYDLLPEGVVPIVSTVKLRNGDIIENIELIENYRGTGRIMMIVKASLRPQYKYAYNKTTIIGTTGYYDQITMTYEANYSWFSLERHGDLLKNYAVFESGNSQIGTIEGLVGEPDDPSFGNHKDSVAETAGMADVLTDINPDNDNQSYLYASSIDSLVVDVYFVTSLQKTVDVNSEGVFSDGIPDDLPRNVYSKGFYTYDVRVKNSEIARSKDMIFYDNLENYVPRADNSNYGDTQWRGTLRSIDVSELISQGVAPVIYYSTVSDLILDDTDFRSHLDLTNSSIWTTTMPSNRASITAIAVDISKLANGNDFVLAESATASFLIEMQAPDVHDLTPNPEEYYDDYLGENGSEAEIGGAHAYNNVSMVLTNISSETGVEVPGRLIRYDYTKVGLKPYSISFWKTWEDDDNRDGIRPEEVTVRLFANGIDTGLFSALSEENYWHDSFEVAPNDDDGKTINYTLREDPVDGYKETFNISVSELGSEIEIINTHEPERIDIIGNKVWIDDHESTRPESISVSLLKNGRPIRTHVVKESAEGEWTFTFNNLFKYENGELIDYSIRENDYVPGYLSEIDEFDVVNTYHPFGDLVISKEIQNATEVAIGLNPEFSFRFTLKNKDGEDDNTEFDYVTSDGRSGKTSNGGVIKIRAGQTATILQVPSDVDYSIEEIDLPPGFEEITLRTKGATGQIKAGEVVNVEFVNEYLTTGSVPIEATKILTGRNLKMFEFIFDLYDEDEIVISSGSNNLEGIVRFGSLKYSNEDVGNTYIYTIRERNTERPGVTYDAHEEVFTVTVDDDGVGNIVAEINFDEDGPVFNNAYQAEGELELLAWKTLRGDFELVDDQFSFKIIDEETDDEVATGTNDKNGLIRFSPISFSEKDIGKTFTFIGSENVGEEENMIYDSTTVEYTVTVFDNGDGTLSFDASATDLYTEDIENEETIPMFVNKYEDGELTVAKYIHGDWKDVPFRFRVVLRGPEDLIPEGEFDLERDQVEAPGVIHFENPPGKTGYLPDGIYLDNTEEGTHTTYLPDGEPYGEERFEGWGYDGGTLSFASEIIYTISETGSLTNVTIEGVDVTDSFSGGILTLKPKLTPDFWIRYETVADGIQIQEFDTGEDLRQFILSNKSTFINDLKVVALLPEITDCSSLFANCTATSIDLSEFNTSNVTNMNEMFASCPSLISLDVSNFNTSNVTSMNGMFGDCSSLTSLDLSGFDTSRVTDMSYMFAGCSSLASLDVSNFDTSNVTSMTMMFGDCSSLTSLDVSNFDTSNVTNMSTMFAGCSSLASLDVSNFDTSSVTSMSSMFLYCSSLTSLDLSNFDTSSVTSMSYMFAYCSSLTSLDVSSFDTSNVTHMNGMFEGCSSLASLNVSGFNTSNVTSMRHMFAYCSSLTSLDLSSFDTSNVTNMSNMFYSATSLSTLTISTAFMKDPKVDGSLDPSCNVITVPAPFSGSLSLDSIPNFASELDELSGSNKLNELNELNKPSESSKFSKFGTLNEKNSAQSNGTMSSTADFWIRYETAVGGIQIQEFDTGAELRTFIMDNKDTFINDLKVVALLPEITDCSDLFSSCTATSIDLSEFNTSNVTDMGSMFSFCSSLTSLDLSSFDTNSVTDMGNMFQNCSSLTSLDLSSFDTSSVADMSGMFYYCRKLTSLDLSNFDTSNVTSMSSMFWGCSSLTSLDVSGFDTSNVTDMGYMFYNCSSLTSLDVSNFNTSNVTDMRSVFYNCASLTSLDVSNFDTSNVTNMSGVFWDCSLLTSLDLSNFDTSNVTTMRFMFVGCSSLTSLDLSSFDTSSVTDMSYMFQYCSSLTSLDLSNFDTSNVTGMWYMFGDCSSLTSLDLSNFDTNSVANMSDMFSGADNLIHLTLGENFAFKGSTNLTADTADGIYTGKWVRDDLAYGPFTPTELENNYTSAMAGTWTRELAPTEYTIFLDPNGGIGSISQIIGEKDVDIELPSDGFYKFNSVLTGWNTLQDGSGDSFQPGETISNPVEPGETFTLFAQYEELDNSILIENGEFTFTLHGGESVTLPNIPAGLTYEVYEETEEGWELLTSANSNGVIPSNERITASFTNKESLTTPAQVTLGGTKLLDGIAASGFRFNLELISGDEKSFIDTATSAGGVFNFKTMNFSEVGIFTFEISEEIGSDPSINYDTHVETLTVTVTEDAGVFSASVETDADGVVFENTSTFGSLNISKVVTGTVDNTKEFVVRLTLNGGPVSEEITLKAGQTANIPNLKIGTTYEVEEINLPAGYKLDGITNSSGTITSETPIEITVNNSYSAIGSVMLRARKELHGRELVAGEFEFQVTDEDGNVVDTARNNADGDVYFNSITINQPGDHYYTITEVKGQEEGIVYDDGQHGIDVTAVDNGDGTLSVTTSGDIPTFNNYYHEYESDFELGVVQIEKKILNVYLEEVYRLDDFEMRINLEDELGQKLDGTYYLENSEDQQVIEIQDGSVVTIRSENIYRIYNLPLQALVTVTELPKENYQLSEELSKMTARASAMEMVGEETLPLKEEQICTVVNIYQPHGNIGFSGTKTLEGKEISKYGFEFLLLKDGEVLQTIINNIDGTFAFEDVYYDYTDIGNTYTYQIVERAGADDNIQYDETVYEFDVIISTDETGEMVIENTLSGEIVFNNVYRLRLAPTGNLGVLVTAFVISTLAAGVMIMLKKRRNDPESQAESKL